MTGRLAPPAGGAAGSRRALGAWRRLPYRVRRRVGSVATVLAVAAIVAYCLLPVGWMAVSSLRRPADLFSAALLPSPVSLDNYRFAFSLPSTPGLVRAVQNSVLIAGVGTLMGLVIATGCAYALARLHFRGRDAAVGLVIAIGCFPSITLIVPLFQFFTTIGWINTYRAVIAPDLSLALPLAVFNLTSVFRQVPEQLEEAARVDGCTPLQALRRIILPVAAPGVLTTGVIVFVTIWNEYFIASSMNNQQEIAPVTVFAYQFRGGTPIPFGTGMAVGLMVTAPVVILTVLFQRRIVSGLTAGALR